MKAQSSSKQTNKERQQARASAKTNEFILRRIIVRNNSGIFSINISPHIGLWRSTTYQHHIWRGGFSGWSWLPLMFKEDASVTDCWLSTDGTSTVRVLEYYDYGVLEKFPCISSALEQSPASAGGNTSPYMPPAHTWQSHTWKAVFLHIVLRASRAAYAEVKNRCGGWRRDKRRAYDVHTLYKYFVHVRTMWDFPSFDSKLPYLVCTLYFGVFTSTMWANRSFPSAHVHTQSTSRHSHRPLSFFFLFSRFPFHHFS